MGKPVKVSRTQYTEVPGLGQSIQAARKADPRPLATLAAEAGISRGYWYEIESEQIRDALPVETLREIEKVLNKQFGVPDEEGIWAQREDS